MLVPCCFHFGVKNQIKSLLGSVLEVYLARLGASESRLVASSRVLERFGGVQEPLGSILERLGAPPSPRGGSARPPKYFKKVGPVWIILRLGRLKS